MASCNSIKELWQDYAGAVMPGEAGPEQIETARKVFYAGALGVTGLMARAMACSHPEHGPQFLSQLILELAAFNLEQEERKHDTPR